MDDPLIYFFFFLAFCVFIIAVLFVLKTRKADIIVSPVAGVTSVASPPVAPPEVPKLFKYTLSFPKFEYATTFSNLLLKQNPKTNSTLHITEEDYTLTFVFPKKIANLEEYKKKGTMTKYTIEEVKETA